MPLGMLSWAFPGDAGVINAALRLGGCFFAGLEERKAAPKIISHGNNKLRQKALGLRGKPVN